MKASEFVVVSVFFLVWMSDSTTGNICHQLGQEDCEVRQDCNGKELCVWCSDIGLCKPLEDKGASNCTSWNYFCAGDIRGSCEDGSSECDGWCNGANFETQKFNCAEDIYGNSKLTCGCSSGGERLVACLMMVYWTVIINLLIL